VESLGLIDGSIVEASWESIVIRVCRPRVPIHDDGANSTLARAQVRLSDGRAAKIKTLRITPLTVVRKAFAELFAEDVNAMR